MSPLINPGCFSGEKGSERIGVQSRPCHSTSSLTVTENEIQSYLQAVNDTNPIHQGKSAIVPGFLMVNKMFEMFQYLYNRFFSGGCPFPYTLTGGRRNRGHCENGR